MTLDMTAKEAAELIRVHESTFKRYARTHRHRKVLEVFRYEHNMVLYSRESVLAFRAANKSKMA